MVSYDAISLAGYIVYQEDSDVSCQKPLASSRLSVGQAGRDNRTRQKVMLDLKVVS